MKLTTSGMIDCSKWWRHQMETFFALLAICSGNSPITGEFPAQSRWCGALMFSLIGTWINGRVNNRKAGDLRRHWAHYGVTVMKYNAHTEPLLKVLDVLKIENTQKFNVLKFYYKYTYGTLPSYFYTDNIEAQAAHHSHDTWQKNQLRTNITRTKYAYNTLRNHLSVLVNGTPLYIFQTTITHNIGGFSSSVKQYYLNMYRVDCSIPNSLVSHQ